MQALAAMMRDPEATNKGLTLLNVRDFYKPTHRKIFDAIGVLNVHDELVDVSTVAHILDQAGDLEVIGGRSALIDIAESVFTATSIEAHCHILIEKGTLRRLMACADKIISDCTTAPGELQKLLSKIKGEIGNITDGSMRNGKGRGDGVLVWLDQVEEETIDWLWKPWLPSGKLAMLSGEPKVGKTTLALQIVASVSMGWGFPSGDGGVFSERREPANSIIMCGEDGLADTIKGRLREAGADHKRVAALTSKRVMQGAEKKEQAITLEDMPIIEEVVSRVKPAVVIIDPIQAYIGSRVDIHRANETRPIMTELSVMAQKYGFCCMVLGHLRKSEGGAMQRALGSIDFVAVARSMILAARDPEGEKWDRVMAHAACNLAAEAKSMKYSIKDGEGFRWGETDDRSADELCRPVGSGRRGSSGKSSTDTIEWLEETLRREGRMTSNEVQAKAAREGISAHGLRTAALMVGVKKERQGGIWLWGLEKKGEGI